MVKVTAGGGDVESGELLMVMVLVVMVTKIVVLVPSHNESHDNNRTRQLP